MERIGNLACPSSKPHFVHPIHADSSSADQLAIPVAFEREYLVDREDSEGVATLKSPLKKSWKVKLNDFKFTDGWEDFYKAHELSTGYYLAFQYQGHDLIFRVWVFTLSYCEVEYSTESLMMSEGEDENEMDRAESVGTSKGNCECEGNGEIKSNGKGRKEPTSSDQVEVDSEESNVDDYDELEEAIPTKFAKSNILDDVETVFLIDEERKEWPIKLTRRSDGYGVHFGSGWKDFQSEKRLKKGDICLFEQKSEDKLEFTVSIIKEI
ncbi:B3 domain-containing protein REM8-like [Papaver somniferum]|uniref:B3 domain-containing protein REM8-like n=1 Tax=Papaver somniferum TaxID=3469 RepID=UPI000E6F473C|nr:B3 domain-containing protein REM8-like [Papaver somniferum]